MLGPMSVSELRPAKHSRSPILRLYGPAAVKGACPSRSVNAAATPLNPEFSGVSKRRRCGNRAGVQFYTLASAPRAGSSEVRLALARAYALAGNANVSVRAISSPACGRSVSDSSLGR